MSFDASLPDFNTNYDTSTFVEILAVATVVLFGLDIAYRIFKTIRVILHYMRGTSVSLPVIDVTKGQKTDMAEFSSSSKCNMVMTFASGPLVGVILVLGLICVIVWFLALLYLQFYNDYQNGCVHSRDGTFLSTNAATLAYHYSAIPGSALKVGFEGEIEIYKTATCNKLAIEDSALIYKSNFFLHKNRTTFLEQSQGLGLLSKCIDRASFPNNTVSTRNGAQLNTQVLFDTFTSCSADKLDFAPDEYVGDVSAETCWNAMPVTEFACSDVSRDAINMGAHNASCDSEWYAHTTLVNMFGVLVMFFSLNVSRRLLLSALTGFFWKWSGEKHLRFQAYCDLNGKIPDLTQEVILQESQKMLRCRNVVSVIKLILSIVIYAPTIYVLILLSDIGSPKQ